MKRALLVFLLLTAAVSLEIRVPEDFQLTDGSVTLMPYVVTDAPVLLKLSWNNEKVDIFPTQAQITPNGGGGSASFLIMTNPGACGELLLTLTAAGINKPLLINLPKCEPDPIIPTNASLPVEDRYLSLKRRKLGTAIEYLQVTPGMKSKMDYIERTIEIAKSETDFNKKTKLADDAWKLVDELEVDTPYVTKIEEKISEIGDYDLRSKAESVIGEVKPTQVLFYKKQITAESAKGGTTLNPVVTKFTLYKIRLYNPESLPKEVFVIENQAVGFYDQTPFYNSDYSIMNVTVPGKGRATLSFGVMKTSQGPVSTAIYEKVEKPIVVEPLPESELESDEGGALPIVEMLRNIFSGILGELDFLTGLFRK